MKAYEKSGFKGVGNIKDGKIRVLTMEMLLAIPKGVAFSIMSKNTKKKIYNIRLIIVGRQSLIIFGIQKAIRKIGFYQRF